MPASATELRRTPLYDLHRSAGARLVPFAGWEMPVSYEGVRPEHVAVRTAAGIFDVSHMGQVETSGPQAGEFLQSVLSNDVDGIETGAAQYALLCREDGGVLDDLITYRLADDRYLTVTNAANHETDLDWLQIHAAAFDCAVLDRAADYAMLALQGPSARELLSAHIDGDAPPRLRAAEAAVCGRPALVCGTGYTGEDGVELLLSPVDAAPVWEALVSGGAVPAGLGARDTLRTEVCYPLYGNELSVERTPIEAGLGWACKEQTGFIGSDSVQAVREAGPDQRLAAFAIDGPGIARQGNPVEGGGEVTSGTFSPCLEVGIGMAYVPAARAEPGTGLEIDVRGKLRRATVKDKPLYRKEG